MIGQVNPQVVTSVPLLSKVSVAEFFDVRKQLDKSANLLMAKVGVFMQNGLKLDNIETKAYALLKASDAKIRASAQAIIQRVTALRSIQQNLLGRSQGLIKQMQGILAEWEKSKQVMALTSQRVNISQLGYRPLQVLGAVITQGKNLLGEGSQMFNAMEKQNAEVSALEKHTDQLLNAAEGRGLIPSVKDILSPITTAITEPLKPLAFGVGIAAVLALVLFLRK